jgi:hypothetical protein
VIASDNNWHHLAMVADGSLLHLYVDGVEQGSAAAIGGTIDVSNGGIGYIVSSPTSRYLTGTVDDVRIYNRALSGAEVQSLAGGQSVRRPHSIFDNLALVYWAIRRLWSGFLVFGQ